MRKDIDHNEAMAKVFSEDPEYLSFYLKQLVIERDFDELLRLCKQLDIDLSELLIKEFSIKLGQL